MQIESKYATGDKVVHFTGLHGMIIAIIHRGSGNVFEMSFCDNDGIPISKIVEECELTTSDNGSLGFEKKDLKAKHR